jgi:predicted nucleic acid-binding protein
MIILDTDVISALMRETPDRQIVAWLDAQPRTSVWSTSVTVMEIQFGLQVMPPGKRRSALENAFEILLSDKIGRRIASYDSDAAYLTAELMAARQKKGRRVELSDSMIAGIALARHATLATRNVSHFEGLAIPLINPWEVSI